MGIGERADAHFFNPLSGGTTVSNIQKKSIRRAAFGLAAFALLIPVTVSTSQGIEGNEACANGTCCREMLSICSADGTSTTHYYQAADGICAPVRE